MRAGDIAFRILEKANKRRLTSGADGGARPHVTVLDINGAMLEEGKLRAAEQGVDELSCTWIEGNPPILTL